VPLWHGGGTPALEVTVNTNGRLVLRPVAAGLGGIVVAAIGLGLTVVLARDVKADYGWGDLVAVVLGTAASVSIGVLVWVSLLVVAARRLLPRGERLAPVLGSVGAVLGVVVLGSVLGGLAAGSAGVAPWVVLLVAAAAVLVVPPGVFVLRARTAPRPGPPTEWPLPPR